VNAPSKFPEVNSSSYQLYLREREYSRTLERLLARSVALLDMETHRRELAGEDVTHLRAFIREARSV
jgi:hypothetical protein